MRDWIAYVRQNLRLSGFRPEREAEIVEDVARQLEDACREALQGGATEEEAQAAALGHVANWAALANEVARSHRGKESAMTIWQQHAEDRDAAKRGRFSLLTDLRQDVCYGLRVLAKSPGFTAVAILTLALGIGANTAIFSLLDAVMLRSLPVRDPQQLMLLKWSARQPPAIHNSASYGDCETKFDRGETSGCSLSKPFLNDLHAQNTIFSGLAAFASARQVTLSGNGPASLAEGQYVSGDYFQTLGVRAAAGRTMEPSDDDASATPVVVLNYGYWKSAFGGDPAAVGRTIHLNGLPFTIAGVAEARFTAFTPGQVYDLWIPLAQRPLLEKRWKPRADDAGSWWVVIVGRLKPGISRTLAESAVTVLFRNDLLHGEKPLAKAEDAPAISLIPAQGGLRGERRTLSTPLYVLMLGVGIVLLIACANVAGLLLARATARQKEIAVRLALGAGRGRIARQFLTESLTLAAAGGLLGIVLAFWSARALLAFLTSTSSGSPGFATEVDLRVLAFTAAASMLAGVLFGLAPALRSMRVDLTPALKDGWDKSGAGHARAGWLSLGNSLVVAQVALTVVVLVGAGLLVHTLKNLLSVDPGFDASNVLNFGVDPTLTGYKGARIAQFYRDLRDRFNALPGVVSAGYSDFPLLSGALMSTSFHLEGTPEKTEVDADVLSVGPDFLETMRMPVILGRSFSSAEFAAAAETEASPSKPQAPVPAVVNEAFVRSYFPHGNPMGRRYGAEDAASSGDPEEGKNPGWQIIGVVRDAKYVDLRREIQPTMYVPAGAGGVFELRTAGDPLALVSGVREVIRQTGSDIPIFDIKTESEQIDRLLFQERLIARLSSLFGLLALLLACIGLYGLLSYEVARRTREIGIRMALGAQAGNVLRAVVGHGIALAAMGVALGIAASFGVTRFLRSLLYDVKLSDPLTLAGVAILLLLVALVACYIPARRATRVDPLMALRHE